jgi:hypothetical protein
MTVSTTTNPIARYEKNGLIVIGVSGAIIFGLAVFVEHRSAPARAAAAQELTAELAAESKAFCEKHGMPANTQGHTDCMSDLQVIRDHQTGRVNESQLGFL